MPDPEAPNGLLPGPPRRCCAGTWGRSSIAGFMLTCGCCESAYTIIGKDVYGCRRHRSMGNCSNGARVSRADVERRILVALKEKLIAPDLIAEFTRAYQSNRMRAPTPRGLPKLL